MLLSGPSHLRDLSQGAGSLCILAVILARHSSVCGCPTDRQPLQLNVAPCWDTFFFVMWMRLLCSSFSGSHHSWFSHNFGVRHRNVCDMCSRTVINFHTSRHNCCIAANDVLSRPASFSSGPPVLCGFKVALLWLACHSVSAAKSAWPRGWQISFGGSVLRKTPPFDDSELGSRKTTKPPLCSDLFPGFLQAFVPRFFLLLEDGHDGQLTWTTLVERDSL